MKIIKTSAVIISSIIGAGFASGKEIFEYFAKYGIYSIFFIIPLFCCISFFVYTFLHFGQKTKTLNYQTCNRILCKNITIKDKTINPFTIFLLISFLILSSAMFSALVALFETYFVGGNKILYFALSIAITYILLKNSFEKFGWLSNIIVPFIIFLIALNLICSVNTENFVTYFGEPSIFPLPFLTIMYASQNTFFCSFVIMNLGKDLNKNQRLLVSLIVAGVISLLILLGILCFLFNPTLICSNMPFAEIAIAINPVFSIIFAIILFAAIVTTYATSLTSLKEFFNGTKKHNKTWGLIMIIVLISLFDFGKIVEYLYPIIGVFGIVYFFRVLAFNQSKSDLSSLNFLFEQTNKKVHSASKQTKNNSTS